jgi:hypothetical protein
MSKASNLIANLRGFLTAADPAGRVHPQVNTLRAKTARMSITNPALQTLKKHDPRLRRCSTADPVHVLISCDFSQVEIHVAAALAKDPTLREVILSGADIHDATAALMYGEGFTDEQRTISKRATFGTIYGGGARALASQTGVTEDTARQVIQLWRTRRGGLHLYFTAPPGLRLGNTLGRSERGLGWLIDTRGRGGYVVAPGSFVDLPDGAGRYEVAYDRPPAPLPDWLTAVLARSSPRWRTDIDADQVKQPRLMNPGRKPPRAPRVLAVIATPIDWTVGRSGQSMPR